MFGIMILSHEFGHFITAKASKMNVEEFSIGMGPAIFKRRKGDTLYSLRVLPIGGYVKIEGEDGENISSNSFTRKPFLARFSVLFAGSFMNILFAIILSMIIIIFSEAIPSTTISKMQDNNISSSYGLLPGDKIIKIENKKVNVYSDIIFSLSQSYAEPVDITVKRDGKTIKLENVEFPVIEENGIKAYTFDYYFYPENKNILTVIKHGFFQCIAITRAIWQSLIDLFVGKAGISQLSGPVGTTKVIGEAAKAGIESLMFFMIFLSINLGLINLLPFPALDGGRIFLLIIEKIRRKPLNPKFEGALNLIGFALLMLLMVYVTFNDIVRLFKG